MISVNCGQCWSKTFKWKNPEVSCRQFKTSCCPSSSRPSHESSHCPVYPRWTLHLSISHLVTFWVIRMTQCLCSGHCHGSPVLGHNACISVHFISLHRHCTIHLTSAQEKGWVQSSQMLIEGQHRITFVIMYCYRCSTLLVFVVHLLLGLI